MNIIHWGMIYMFTCESNIVASQSITINVWPSNSNGHLHFPSLMFTHYKFAQHADENWYSQWFDVPIIQTLVYMCPFNQCGGDALRETIFSKNKLSFEKKHFFWQLFIKYVMHCLNTSLVVWLSMLKIYSTFNMHMIFCF